MPLRIFFPPLETRPHVAVRSPFRPGGGGEGLGERGGIQKQQKSKDGKTGTEFLSQSGFQDIAAINCSQTADEQFTACQRNAYLPGAVAADGLSVSVL